MALDFFAEEPPDFLAEDFFALEPPDFLAEDLALDFFFVEEPPLDFFAEDFFAVDFELDFLELDFLVEVPLDFFAEDLELDFCALDFLADEPPDFLAADLTAVFFDPAEPRLVADLEAPPRPVDFLEVRPLLSLSRVEPLEPETTPAVSSVVVSSAAT